MCYDISYLTKKQTDYAKRYGSQEDVNDIKKRLPATFHTNGFQHSVVPVLTEKGRDLQAFEWGLIPFWVKTKEDSLQIRDKTLNARGETLFEKPAFRNSAQTKRCLVMVDGFFENHHFQGKSYPYFIERKDGQPFALGGVFDEWEDIEEGLVRYTFSIITTSANPRMKVIHNNPKVLKRGGPRMPLIVPFEKEDTWLDPELPKEKIEALIKPFPETELTDYTVPPLRGKNAVGNQPSAIQKFNYPALNNIQQSLF